MCCQLDSWEQNAGGMEPSIDCRAWRTRGSEEEEEAMQDDRVKSMIWTKREGGRRVTSSLSESVGGRRSGRQESTSGLVSWEPGTWVS